MTPADPGPLRGLTWDHPRGYQSLEALSRLDATGEHTYGAVPVPLRWDRQPLQGFESTPVAQLADRYDLLVIDHPHLADAVDSGALLAMDEVVGKADMAACQSSSIGTCFDSYQVGGRQWAAPLDAAAQVAVVRPDLLGPQLPPRDWQQVLDLSRAVPTMLCLGGPHALLMLMALLAAQGDTPAIGEDFADRQLMIIALELMAEILRSSDPGLAGGEPSTVLDAMAAGAPIAYCPLVFGYATYSRPCTGRYPLDFHDAPAWQPGGAPVGVLGGTGLAVSARTRDLIAVGAHVRRLMSRPVQTHLLPRYSGQPAFRAAWNDAALNATNRNFFANTMRTIEHAWVRPRRRHFVCFTDRASAIVREGLLASDPVGLVADRVEDCYRAVLAHPSIHS